MKTDTSKVPLATHAASALSLYADNFLLFISFPILQLLVFVSYVIAGIAGIDFRSVPGIAWNVVGTFAYYYLCLCLIYVVMQRVRGGEVTLKAAMVNIATRWYPLLFWYVAYRMNLDKICFSRFAIIGLYVAVVTTFMPYAAVCDELGFKDSLVRSYDLVKRRFWQASLANLLPMCILWCPQILRLLLPNEGLFRMSYIDAAQVFVIFLSPLLVAFYACLFSEYKAVYELKDEQQKSSSRLQKLLAPLIPRFVKEYVDWFKYGLRLSEMNCEEKSEELVYAAYHGRLDIVIVIVNKFGLSVDIKANEISAVQAAAENGHLDVIKWLVVESGQSADVTANDNAAVCNAAYNGHLDVVRWLVKESGQAVDVTSADNLAVQCAAGNGHLDVVKWLISESGQQVDVTSGDNFTTRVAVQRGHLDVVKWLVKDSGQLVNVTANDNVMVQDAAYNGHLDVVKWLVKESGQAVDVTSTDNLAVHWAARNGHLDVVKWLVTESGQKIDVTANDSALLFEAADNGHLDVVKWLVKDSGQPVDATAADNNAVQCAAGNGHLNVVKWLVEESGQPVDVTVDDNWSVRGAAQKGHLDVIKWLIENSGQAIDCRNCRTWEVTVNDKNDNDILVSFDEWPQESKNYLLEVKALQDNAGAAQLNLTY